MREQLRMDFKNNFKNSFTWAIFVGFLLVFLTSFFYYFSDQRAEERNPNVPPAMHGSISGALSTVRDNLEVRQSKETLDEAALKLENTRRKYLEDLIFAISAKPTDIDELNQLNYDYATFNLAEYEAGRGDLVVMIPYPYRDTTVNQMNLQNEVQWADYLLKHHIVETAISDYHIPAVNYLEQIFLYTVSPLMILFFCCLQMVHLFTLEKRNNTIAVLNNLPYAKFKILISKVVAFFGLTIPLIFGAALIAFLVDAHYYGVGPWSFPALFSPDSQHKVVTSIAVVLGLYLVVLLFVLLFLSSISALVSLFSKKFAVNLLALVLPLLIVQRGLPNLPALKLLDPFLPFSYFAIPSFIFQNTSWPVGSFVTGLVVLACWSGIFYGLSYLVLQKRKAI